MISTSVAIALDAEEPVEPRDACNLKRVVDSQQPSGVEEHVDTMERWIELMLETSLVHLGLAVTSGIGCEARAVEVDRRCELRVVVDGTERQVGGPRLAVWLDHVSVEALHRRDDRRVEAAADVFAQSSESLSEHWRGALAIRAKPKDTEDHWDCWAVAVDLLERPKRIRIHHWGQHVAVGAGGDEVTTNIARNYEVDLKLHDDLSQRRVRSLAPARHDEAVDLLHAKQRLVLFKKRVREGAHLLAVQMVPRRAWRELEHVRVRTWLKATVEQKVRQHCQHRDAPRRKAVVPCELKLHHHRRIGVVPATDSKEENVLPGS